MPFLPANQQVLISLNSSTTLFDRFKVSNLTCLPNNDTYYWYKTARTKAACSSQIGIAIKDERR